MTTLEDVPDEPSSTLDALPTDFAADDDAKEPLEQPQSPQSPLPAEDTSVSPQRHQQQPQPDRPPHPYANASFLSKLLFLWPYPLLKLGLQRPLTDFDLADVVEADSSTYNLHYLRQHVLQSPQFEPDDKTCLARLGLRDLLHSTWYVQPMLAAAVVAKVVQAVALGQLIDVLEGRTTDRGVGYGWATLLVLCSVVTLLEHHHAFFILWRRGMQYRIAVVAAIYEKTLRLSSTHTTGSSSSQGQVMNLASNDVERFMYSTLFVSFLFWSPLQAVGIAIVGSLLVGPAFLAGVAWLVLVFCPLQVYLSRRFAALRSTMAPRTDQRVNFVTQAVRGARVMKVAGYETQFLTKIQELRAQEVQQLKQAVRCKAANEALFFVTNIVVSVIIFVTHVFAARQTLRPGDVFMVFTLVNVMQLELVKHVSIGIMASSECYVSTQRIQTFLTLPEHETTAQKTDSDKDATIRLDEPAISMKDVTCHWSTLAASVSRNSSFKSLASLSQTEKNKDLELSKHSSGVHSTMAVALQNITVDFAHGSLTAVIGPVGSGKSALLQALVQELKVSSGNVQRNYQSLAYCSQDPWIMDGTIRENIFMGMEDNWDADWYQQVIQSCSLELDFTQLRDGDQTIVGDRGVQLSGGQRARIGLARALFQNADVLILDDPISAVDARVGRHMFQKAIMNLSVNRGKCVVLATHQHQHIHETRCVLITHGEIKCIGSYEECVTASNGKLVSHDADTSVDNLPGSEPSHTDTLLSDEPNSDLAQEEEALLNVDKKPTKEFENEQAETNNQGIVRSETYLNYVRALGGLWVGVALLILFACTQASVLVTVATMGRWAEQDASGQKDTNIVVTVVAMAALVVLLATVRAFLSLELTIVASQRLHDRMALSVIRSKIEFFDTNPLGRILNRFSADTGIADDQLPQTLFDVFVISFIVLGSVVTALTTLPFALIVVPFLLYYFINVRKVFVSSTRELKRLEGIARSPIFAMMSEALGGIATIRANNYLDFFRKKFCAAHDAHTRVFFGFISSSRWVGFRMDSIVVTFLCAVTFLAVLSHDYGWFDVDPAILGLSISMLIYLSGVFQWCIRQSAEVVNQMVSVERVLEFGQLESEAALHCPPDDALLAKGWPSAGAIEYENISVRYRSTLPLALKKISFRIPAGARVGVVGRTGSGKSTVVQTLFRLLEPEHGRIRIDGQDISEIGLHALRPKISVIPQVPTLFSGCTIRQNLDLFELHSNDEIEKVLQACHLSEAVEELPDRWNTIVSEGGSNFSVGQRQLLCLARAILSKNKILVLDEATASVDRRTDQLLQQTLQETYHGGTILAVAHRLDTIIDYDYVLVLGQGEVIEFGSPHELLSNNNGNGTFAQMVRDTGDAMSKSLREQASVSLRAIQKKDD